ncbi:hypothetical protein Tco_0442919 [Tanacetum coccineum]
MNDKGEIGFRLGDIKFEDNYKSMGVGITKKEQTIASSANKGNAIAEPSTELTTKPKATKDPKGKMQLLQLDNIWRKYMTWAHLGKKRTRLQLYTKFEEEMGTQTLETASKILVTPLDHQRDGVRKIETASGLNRHSETLEDSVK